jgi:hypothetical protein
MVEMCKNISPNIKIIKTNYDNLLPSEYSRFLSSLSFWKLLHGEKILIYQEDSIIFHKNIENFLHFDYIGAPWPEDSNNNRSNVGNGGISLRSKKIMIKIINKINIMYTKLNSGTIKYMKETNSFVPPEDVYFTKNIEDYNIGLLADRISATNFSTESIYNKKSFCGHNFWISNNKWKKTIYKNNIIQFKPCYNLSMLEHRGGWKTVLEKLEDNNFFNKKSKYYFFDMIESNFLWNTDFTCNTKWSGIVHCTPKTPPYLEIINIDNLFNNKNFIESLKSCICIFTLSNYISNYLKNKINTMMNLNINIYTLKLPTVFNNIPQFNINKYVYNNNKLLIQIGQQLRKLSSIYLLKSINLKKIWLTGTLNFNKMTDLLNKEIEYLNIDKSRLDNNVQMYYTKTYEEYDELLIKNIVFIDLFDAGANTAVIECIVRNTPIIINKIEGVIDYLGENYPLYYTNLEEVENLLNIDKIIEAHNYLLNMNKNDLNMDFFTKNLYTNLYNHI